MKKYFVAFVILCSFALIISCEKIPNSDYFTAITCDEPDDTLNTYNLKIATILNDNCALSGCHDVETAKKAIILTDYMNSVNAFENHPVLCSIHQDGSCAKMPRKADKLSDDKIHDLTCWAKNGYPE